MNFYNTLLNLPDDFTPSPGAKYEESIAGFHFSKARDAISRIEEIDPGLAQAVADAIFQALLAANAYNHDMFQRSLPSGEDLADKIRKNR